MVRSAIKSALSFTVLATLALLAGTPAQALNTKSFVSNTGSDVNNCSDVTINACATFAHALTQTVAGGEITVVNTASTPLAAASSSPTAITR